MSLKCQKPKTKTTTTTTTKKKTEEKQGVLNKPYIRYFNFYISCTNSCWEP